MSAQEPTREELARLLKFNGLLAQVARQRKAWVMDAARTWAANPAVRGERREDTMTALMQRALTHIMSRDIDRKYPGIVWQQVLPPPSSEVPEGAETVDQQGFDSAGEATDLDTYSEDIREVTLTANSGSTNIKGIGVRWSISIQQMRAGQMAKVDLNRKGLAFALRTVAQRVDQRIWLGDSARNIRGFAKMPTCDPTLSTAVRRYGPGVGTWHGLWANSGTTAAEIKADFALLWAAVTSGKIWVPSDLLVDGDIYGRMLGLEHTANTDLNILEWLEAKYKIKVTSCERLDTASATGAGRSILWAKSFEVAEPVVTVAPELLPPEWRGVGYSTVVHARCGGVQVGDATGACYGDQA